MAVSAVKVLEVERGNTHALAKILITDNEQRHFESISSTSMRSCCAFS